MDVIWDDYASKQLIALEEGDALHRQSAKIAVQLISDFAMGRGVDAALLIHHRPMIRLKPLRRPWGRRVIVALDASGDSIDVCLIHLRSEGYENDDVDGARRRLLRRRRRDDFDR